MRANGGLRRENLGPRQVLNFIERRRRQPKLCNEGLRHLRRGLPGQGPTRIIVSGNSVLIGFSLVGPIDYELYRLELVNNDSQKVIWTSEPLRTKSNRTFYVEFPSRILPDGTYEVAAYGLRGNAQEPVATYSIDVHRPRAR